MKNALPDNAKLSKEAKECMQECASEFVSFIASEGKLMNFVLIRSSQRVPTPTPLFPLLMRFRC